MWQIFGALADVGSVVGEESFAGAGPFCHGGVANPEADPAELQLMRLAKKVTAGARFLITEPVTDVERFEAWLSMVTERGIHERVALVAGIEPTGDAVETIKRLSELNGLRGFQICAEDDADAALDLIEKSGLGIE